MMPMSKTVSESPPRRPPNTFCMVRIIWRAMPDWSSIRPMKMNMGSATRTGFLTMPPKIRPDSADSLR